MEADWKLSWVQIGWKSTIRNGWAIVCSYDDNVCVWIENGDLTVHDSEKYYPRGLYEIPLDLIKQLIEKEKQNEQDTPTFMD